jgi:hypothetical protein
LSIKKYSISYDFLRLLQVARFLGKGKTENPANLFIRMRLDYGGPFFEKWRIMVTQKMKPHIFAR